MSIYRYSNGSVIDEITFKRSDNGAVRAYIHAHDGVDKLKLAEITEELAVREWQFIPSTQNGKPALEIRGFGKEEKLKQLLSDNAWINGKPTIEQEKEDKTSFSDKFKKRSLQASGLFYLLSDAAYTAYGYKKAHWEDIAAGVGYLAGSSVLTAYGKHDTATTEIHDIAKKMEEAVKQHAEKLPDNCSLSAITKDHKHGIIKTADDFLKRYPSEMLNASFILAGGLIMTSAFRNGALSKNFDFSGKTPQQIKDLTKSAWMNVGIGVVNMVGGLSSIMITEKAHDPDAPKKHGLESLWEKIQEKPLAVAGISYIVSTIFHAGSNYKDYIVAKQTGDKQMLAAVPYRAAFIGACLVAEVLMAVSSKGHGSGVIVDNSVDESIVSLAADLIVQQPAKDREQLIDYLATFLWRDDVMAMKDEQVKALLQKEVALAENNPWAKCSSENHVHDNMKAIGKDSIRTQNPALLMSNHHQSDGLYL